MSRAFATLEAAPTPAAGSDDELPAALAKEEYLYHVTFYGRLASIAEEGLVADAPRSIGTESYDSNRKGRVFLTTRDGCFYWFSKVDDFAQHGSDDMLEGGFTPVVLRADTSGLFFDDVIDIHPDEVANSESISSNAWFVEKAIDAGRLEVWDGKEWISLSDWESVDPEKSYTLHEPDEDEAEDYPDGWHELRDWRDNPLFPKEAHPA